jgi:Predicted alternative thymidylate synthase
MDITAEVVLKSNGQHFRPLVTFKLVYPRFIHPQVMTHRVFSRNVSSSRAIPTEKLIELAIESDIRPLQWGENARGMSSHNVLAGTLGESADWHWCQARQSAIEEARSLSLLGVHKQWANRLLEPFLPVTTLLTATDFDNFYMLRLSQEAQPEIKMLAEEMLMADEHAPVDRLIPGEWHMPFVLDEELDEDEITRMMISVARCARVSYTTPDNDLLSTVERDIQLYERLRQSGHWSPFEHVAQMLALPTRIANFTGWLQYRQLLDSASYQA